MREILFRGKRADTGEWVYGDFLHLANAIVAEISDDGLKIKIIEGYDVDPATVGQFTGLFDKNGKRIFEGDLIKTHSGLIGKVTFGSFDDGEDLFCAYGWYWSGANKNDQIYCLALDHEWNGHEIVGNIHDNLELLNGV